MKRWVPVVSRARTEGSTSRPARRARPAARPGPGRQEPRPPAPAVAGRVCTARRSVARSHDERNVAPHALTRAQSLRTRGRAVRRHDLPGWLAVHRTSRPRRPGLLQGDLPRRRGRGASGEGSSARAWCRPTSARSPTAARERSRRCSPRWAASCVARRGARPAGPAGRRAVRAHRGRWHGGRRDGRGDRARGLVAKEERDAWAATTYGTGELICAAVDAGARVVVVAWAGRPRRTAARARSRPSRSTAGSAARAVVVLCDVRTPLERAPAVFGPQKGADPAMVARLEERLDALAARSPRDPRGVPMTGAAGGLSGGLWAARGAALEPGAPLMLGALDFDARMRAARAVVTGEGKLDEQRWRASSWGDRHPRAPGRGPVHAIVGRGRARCLRQADHRPPGRARGGGRGRRRSRRAGEQIGRLLATGEA